MEVDFDPNNASEIESNTKCFSNDAWTVNLDVMPLLTVVNLPERYVPVHRCMNVKLRYLERIPTIGPHRPLWAQYGEYEFLPPQRWLHNVEHGAIVGLYHPCADKNEVFFNYSSESLINSLTLD